MDAHSFWPPLGQGSLAASRQWAREAAVLAVAFWPEALRNGDMDPCNRGVGSRADPADAACPSGVSPGRRIVDPGELGLDGKGMNARPRQTAKTVTDPKVTI